MSNEPLAEFNRRLATAKGNWNIQAAQLVLAYSDAYTAYDDTIKLQLSADKAAAEAKAAMVMLAFSVASGVMLGAVFANTAAKSVAGELAKKAALDVVVRRNMVKSFEALAWAEKSVAAKFVMGKIWDQAATKVSNSVKTSITNATTSVQLPTGPVGPKPTPLEYSKNMEIMIHAYANAVSEAGRWMYDNKGGSAGLALMLKESPFLSKIPRPIKRFETAQKMELSFWMKFILDQDFLAKGYLPKASVHNEAPVPRISSRTAISESPSARNYPKYSSEKPTHGSFQDVGYNDVGGVISAKINGLCLAAKIGTGPFMEEGSSWFQTRNVSKELLIKAEKNLDSLGQINAGQIRGG